VPGVGGKAGWPKEAANASAYPILSPRSYSSQLVAKRLPSRSLESFIFLTKRGEDSIVQAGRLTNLLEHPISAAAHERLERTINQRISVDASGLENLFVNLLKEYLRCFRAFVTIHVSRQYPKIADIVYILFIHFFISEN